MLYVPYHCRKKVKTTSKYIYKTLFLNGENSDITIVALGQEWPLHKVYLCQVSVCSEMQGSVFVCLGLILSTFKLMRSYHVVPACSSDTLTNVLPHRNVMPQTQDITPHPITVYRYRADLSLYYLLMWNVTLEYTTTDFNILGNNRSGNPSPTFHTHQQTFKLYDAVMVVVSPKLVRKCTVPLNWGPVVCKSITLSARPHLLPFAVKCRAICTLGLFHRDP